MSEREAATANLLFPEKLYVGTKEGKPFNTENPPLAFATAADTAGFEKRKATVDTWMGSKFFHSPMKDESGAFIKDERGFTKHERIERTPWQEPVIIDNVPLSGFSFEKSVSRWTTSNKWFTINDPRGFSLQISAENLGDIILNNGVIDGDLQGEYIWARHKSNIFLCRTTHSSYTRQDKLIQRTDLKLGDVILMGQDKTEWEFLGVYYTTRYGSESRYVVNATGEILPAKYEATYNEVYGGYNISRNPRVTRRSFLGYVFDARPVFAFRPVGTNSTYIKVMRSKPTRVQILREGNPTFTIMEGSAHQISTNLPGSYGARFFSELENMESSKESLITEEAVRSGLTKSWVSNYSYGFIGELTA